MVKDIQKNELSEVINEVLEKQEKCGKKGHPNALVTNKEYMPYQRAFMECPDCRAIYNRPLNNDERKEMDYLLNKPFDI